MLISNFTQTVPSPSPPDEVGHVCLLSDQHRVLALAGNRLHFMDLRTGELLRVLPVPEVHDDDVTPGAAVERLLGRREVMCGPPAGGRHMGLRAGHVVYVLDLQQMTLTHTLEGHVDAVTCVAMCGQGGHLVSGSLDRTVRVS